ncbi:MAG: ribbon-helix-helix protein, CopG family [Candidatus Bathyarchaeia archaeon]
MFSVTFWQMLRWVSLIIIVACIILLIVGLKMGWGLAPPPQARRHRLIWREGESPWVPVDDAPAVERADTHVSPPLASVDPGREGAGNDTSVSTIALDPAPSRVKPRGRDVERKIANFYLSKHLLEEFKEACKSRGASMSEVLEGLIAEWLGNTDRDVRGPVGRGKNG